MFAATQTTTLMSSNALMHLSNNPGAAKKLRGEVHKIIGHENMNGDIKW